MEEAMIEQIQQLIKERKMTKLHELLEDVNSADFPTLFEELESRYDVDPSLFSEGLLLFGDSSYLCFPLEVSDPSSFWKRLTPHFWPLIPW